MTKNTLFKARKLASNLARKSLGYLPVLKIISRPSRPNGISLIVRNKNEEWIRPSLLSAKDFADEIIVADVSTDNSREIINSLAEEEGLNLKLIKIDDNSGSIWSNVHIVCEQGNLAIKNSTYRFLFKWDGDFIARTSGKYNIKRLREFILQLNNNRYFMIYLTFINLDGDLFHTLDSAPQVSGEAHVFSYSQNINYKPTKGHPRLKLPLYYGSIVVKEPYIFHLRYVKSLEHFLCRHFWVQWGHYPNLANFSTLQSFIKHEIKEKWKAENTRDFAITLFKQRLIRNLKRYDETALGEYPDVLKPYLADPKYRIIYKDGKPFSRNDIESGDLHEI